MDVAALFASLEPLGGETDLRPAVALLAGRDLEFEPVALNAALRRAMLLLAAGGDPHRELDLDGRAVTGLADELDTAPLRASLADGLSALAADVRPFPNVEAATAELARDPALAVRAWACALLAEELD